jgi:hypothetical protein
MLNLLGSVMSCGGMIPARPKPPNTSIFRAAHDVDIPTTPVSKSVWVDKLGYKRMPMIGSDIWNKRHIRLEATTCGYYIDEMTQQAKGIYLSY